MGRVIHFEIQASNPQAMMKFFTELLGWKFTQWGDIDFWMIDTGQTDQPGINGGLMPRRGPVPTEGQSVNAYVCTVQVDSLDNTLTKALTLGATVAVPKMPIPGVGWLAYIKDPDGSILGLMQPDTSAA